MTTASKDHPLQTLLFFVDDVFTPSHVAEMKAIVGRLAQLRRWVIGPPEFIYSAEVSASLRPGDDPIRTLGGSLRLYSALPPWGAKLPREIDRKHCEEVDVIVTELVGFSAASSLSIGFDLDGTSVGWIKDGKPDRTLAIGLLGEWKKAVGLA